MEPKVVYHENGETHAAPRVFRFVDQTDRSQKAVSEHKALVRSHVMTEIRRQRRSKVRLEPETWTHFHDSHEGTDNLRPENSYWTSPQVPPHLFDQMIKADFRRTRNLLPERDDGNERQQAKVTIPYASNLQAMQPSDSIPGGPLYDGLQTHTSDRKSAWSQSFSSAEPVTFNASSEHEALLQGLSYEEGSERVVHQPRSINISPTILGASRVDPFRPLPISGNREVYELVDNYTVAIPVLMYGTHTRKPVHLRLYDVATDDPAAFHSLLAYSARQLDFMAGSPISKRTLRHSSTTLRLIYERLKDPSFRCGDGLIMAVALLAFAERRFGDDMIAQQHWLALREILKSRGGIVRLNINRWLAAVLYWNSLVWSSNFNHDNAAQREWPSLIAQNETVTGLPAAAEFTNFLIGLASAKGRLLDHIRTDTCSAACLHSCSRRRAVLEPNGPLYKIVTTMNLREAFDDDSAAAAAAAAGLQRTSSACEVPCLLYLNIVMIEYESKPELLRQFLGKLIVCIYEDSLDMDVSAEHLLIRLLGGLEDTTSELTSRAHKTIRMAAVIQKLGAKSQQRVHRALVEALVYPGSGTELGASDSLLSTLAESLERLPRPDCVSDLDRFITAPPCFQRASGEGEYM